MARYLSALLYRASGRPDDSAIDLKQLNQRFVTQPNVYDFPVPPLPSLVKNQGRSSSTCCGFPKDAHQAGQQSEDQHLTNLIVVLNAEEDKDGHLNLVNVAPINFPGVEGGYNFKAELPEMLPQPSGREDPGHHRRAPAGELALIEKLDAVALETYKLSETPIFFKTVTRTVVKGVLTEKAKEEANNAASGNGALSLLSLAGGLAADLAVDASEQADLRTRRFFPGQAYVGEFSVPPGKHDVAVEYYGRNGCAALQRTDRPEGLFGRHFEPRSSYDLE